MSLGQSKPVERIQPGSFNPDNHFYPKALNAQLHPMVSYFLSLTTEQLIDRHCHLNPLVSPDALRSILTTPTKHFHWGGSDLFYVTTEKGNRRMVVLETNSCPSGQKSMPSFDDSDEYRGYKAILSQSFLPALKSRRLPEGELAVLYDKNYMECSGYAAALADLTQQPVYLIPHMKNGPTHVLFQDGVMFLKQENDKHIPIKAALRYVTQSPWDRIPVVTKTFIYNSTLVCLAGGRNKLLASKAYEMFNSETHDDGLSILTPKTIRDVSKIEVPLWVQRFRGYAVVKNPYSNAGQGVYTITSQQELDEFMAIEHKYDQFIVQSLIGHYNWSSTHDQDRYYHIGTVPSKKNHIFVADLRMMVYSTSEGYRPCALYARRALSPLQRNIADGSSWNMLGTNLSIKGEDGSWDSDTSRLMLMDRKDFNSIGIGLDDLIEAYIQTILSITAIDKMAQNLINKKNQFKCKLFSSLDPDPTLIKEVVTS